MTLKENSKAYIFLLVSMLLNAIYSLVMTVWAVINNLGLPNTSGVNIASTINAISGRLPIIVLCVLFITAGKKVEKCLKALSVYYVLNIALVVFVLLVNFITWHSIGNPFATYINILLSVLAFIGIWDIKNGGRTSIFRCVLIVMIAYEVYINGSIIISTAKNLIDFPNFYIIQFTSILGLLLYVIFNTSLYIFAWDIRKINIKNA